MAKINSFRKSYFNGNKGNSINFFGLLYALVAICGVLLRRFFRHKSEKLTISFRVTKVIETVIQSYFCWGEFGSWITTVRLVFCCKFFLSKGTDILWYKKIKRDLNQKSFDLVKYELYSHDRFSVLSEFEDKYFDVFFLDGGYREGSSTPVLPKFKNRGLLYFNNLDRDMTNLVRVLSRATRFI